ncbi:response regulator [bacterium]|nr:response regulator [bacterium]
MQNQYKILAVDDDLANLNIITEILSDDYDVKTVESGEKALSVIDDFSPDLVLLDIMMPGIDGYEVCKIIRSNPRLANTKVLFLSAKELLEDRLTGYDSGGDDYITKPFDEEELVAKIKVFLRLKYEEEIRSLNKIVENGQPEVFNKISQYFSSVLYIHSTFPYCKIICKAEETDSLLLRTTLKELEKQFDGQDLLRIHKSYLINPIKVVSISKKGSQDYEAVLKDNDEKTVKVPIGRKYHTSVKKINPKWFMN